MNSLTIIPCQSKVKLIGSDFIGIVNTVQISNSTHVIYQVSWWNQNDRNQAWFESFEIEPVVDARTEVRFGLST
jgi:hypothetical protein